MLDQSACEAECEFDRTHPVQYQIQFPNGKRNPGKFLSPTAAREYADAMPWFTGYTIVTIQ